MRDSEGDEYLLHAPDPNANLSKKGHARDHEAARLKATGMPLDEICKVLGLGDDPRRAAAAIRRALADIARFAGDELRLMELHSLDELEWQAWQTLKKRHVIINGGRVMRDDDDEMMEDDRFVLEVCDRILKIKERRARLMGLDAPTRAEVVTLDSVEAEIARLEREVRDSAG
jgi:DNA-binding transcriptional MerR regulator